MNIGIIDADLIGKQEHNFPNLACMKLSGYHKKRGDKVRLISYSEIAPDSLFVEPFDIVYISKVFTSTEVPSGILSLPFVQYGGTGFFLDNASPLPYEIEHSFPDYNLYDDWIKEKDRAEGYFKYYIDFSIGFTTRGCFRKCDFCVNKNSNKAILHSTLSEFLDKDRKYICLLDDNVLACGEYLETIIKELQNTGKSFQFKQGLDLRLVTPKRAKMLVESKYVGEYIFAFDNIADRELIERKLSIWKSCYPEDRKWSNWIAKLYVLVAFDRQNKYDYDFWVQDIIDCFERIKILRKYNSLAYIMMYERYVDSPFKMLYTAIRSYCNAPSQYSKKTFKEYVGNYFNDFENKFPEIAEKYFYMKENVEQRIIHIVEPTLF